MSSRRRIAAIALAMAAITLLSCGGPSQPAPPPPCGASDGIWASSDYTSSAVGSFALSGNVTSLVGRVDLGTTPSLSVSRGRAFYVAEDQDAIFEVDPTCGTPMSRYDVHLASHSGTSDPYDVAVASDGSLWVVLYEAAAVVVLSPSGDITSTIDLSSYDGDGDPDADAISIVDTPAGEKAFVALQRLDPYPTSVQPSWMLRIDVPTQAVETHLVLAGRNPFGPMQDDDGILWIAEPGNWDDATEPDAGVERFDTSTSTSALVASEPALGGSVAGVSVSSSCAVAILAGATTAAGVNATSLGLFDPTTGAVTSSASASPLATDGFDLEGLAWSGTAFLVGDRRRAAQGYPVHVFDGQCTPVERPDVVFLPLPPIAFGP